MKILLINQNWFAEEFRSAGHEVRTAGLSDHLDFKLPFPLVNIHTVLSSMQFQPDRIVVHDNSAPLPLSAMEECPIPMVFLSVDTHHHASYHKYLGQLFDHTFISQKDFTGEFQAVGVHPEWMPLWASVSAQPREPKEHGAVFIGTLNPKLNPERVKFFEALQAQVPLLCRAGDFLEIFPVSEVVVNQTVKGDLNFRVFEAMMCGAALLTERNGNGLLDLFRDGEEIVTYEKGNVQEAAAKIKELLSDIPRARRIAAAGRASILAHHLPIHRAKRILQVLTALSRNMNNVRAMGAMANHTTYALRLEKFDTSVASRAYLAALRAAQLGLERKEPVNDDLAGLIVLACLRYDTYLNTGGGALLLGAMAEAYPDITIFSLAYIRTLLNRGAYSEAKSLASRFVPQDPAQLFESAEQVISTLLREATESA